MEQEFIRLNQVPFNSEAKEIVFLVGEGVPIQKIEALQQRYWKIARDQKVKDHQEFFITKFGKHFRSTKKSSKVNVIGYNFTFNGAIIYIKIFKDQVIWSYELEANARPSSVLNLLNTVLDFMDVEEVDKKKKPSLIQTKAG